MSRLHDLGAIPFDLAARTCQLTSNLEVKVGDFGLASAVHLEDYVPVNGESFPVRWFPPELLAFIDQTRPQDSDCESDLDLDCVTLGLKLTREQSIWSLAVTLWEVINCGFFERPFSELSDNQFVKSAVGQPQFLNRRRLGPISITVRNVTMQFEQVCSKRNNRFREWTWRISSL